MTFIHSGKKNQKNECGNTATVAPREKQSVIIQMTPFKKTSNLNENTFLVASLKKQAQEVKSNKTEQKSHLSWFRILFRSLNQHLNALKLKNVKKSDQSLSNSVLVTFPDENTSEKLNMFQQEELQQLTIPLDLSLSSQGLLDDPSVQSTNLKQPQQISSNYFVRKTLPIVLTSLEQSPEKSELLSPEIIKDQAITINWPLFFLLLLIIGFFIVMNTLLL